MRTRTKLGLCIVVAVLSLLLALPATAASVPPVPRPTWNNGSAAAECSQIGYSFGLKVESPFNGTYTAFGSQTITVYGAVGNTLNWSSTFGVDAVAVKAGQGANVYFYNESLGDTGLVAFENKDISHITFCWDYELTASKTASASFTRTYTWTIDKSVAPDTHSGFAGANFSSDYDVFVDQTVVDSNFVVSGSITVNNPTPIAVNFSVSDSVNGTAASVNCPASQVPAFGSVVCSYSATLGGAVDGTNTATITSNTAGVAGTSASAGYAFVPTIVGYPTVNVTDTLQGPLGSASGDRLFEYPRPFSCPADPSYYTNGVYSYSVPNTASIIETGQNDSANVTVNCYLPLVSKNATATYDETHTWTLSKSVNPENQTGVVGDVLPWTWQVDVSETSADSNFMVTGAIVVTNPAPFPLTVSVADVLNDGTVALVDCGGGSTSLTIAANGSGQCAYVATPSSASATNNTASATVNGVSVTFTAAVNFVKNVIGGSATVTDTEIGLNQPLTAGQGPWQFTANDSHTCSMNPADYGVGGSYSGSVPNTANLVANNGQNLSDDATTSFTCYAPVVTKTAEAAYDERHDWSIVKTVDPEDQYGFAGNPVNWTWTIEITETVVDEGFSVTGLISVYNPSPEDAMTLDVADVLSDATVATVDCGAGSTSLTVQPQETGVCTYSAAPADASATLNTATATFNTVAFVATAPVSFTTNVLNDSATFSDPYLNISDTVVNDSSSENYPEDDVCSSDQADYGDDGQYTVNLSNTAYLVDEEGTPYQSTAETSYTCYAPVVTKTADAEYDERHVWDIEKSVDPESQSGYPGDVLSWEWTVDVTKQVFEENFAVSGTISVFNPSPDEIVVDVSDTLDDGSSVTVDCDGLGGTSLTIAAGGTGQCSYSASPADASATLNTATAAFNGLNFTGTAPVSFAVNIIDGTATVTDDQIGLDEQISGNGPWQYSDTDSHTCSSSRSDYGADGTYSATVDNTAVVTGSSGQTDSDDASTTYTCEAAFVEIVKTTNGAVNPDVDWTFVLYEGPDGFGTTPIGTSSTSGDADGVLDFGGPALRPDTTYTVCEVGSPAGYLSNWQVNGVDVTPYNPDALDEGNRCVDFGADTDLPLTVGQTLSFVVDNVTPGGDPRTPGYWKNWTACGKGNQVVTAARNGGWQNGFWLLEDVLVQSYGGAIVWDDILSDSFLFRINTCQIGVSILDHRDLGTGRVSASDPGFKLARNLFAAQLNFGAGACTTPQVLATAQLAEALLDKYNYDGAGKSGLSKADEALALSYATMLDNYNNGAYCGSFTP